MYWVTYIGIDVMARCGPYAVTSGRYECHWSVVYFGDVFPPYGSDYQLKFGDNRWCWLTRHYQVQHGHLIRQPGVSTGRLGLEIWTYCNLQLLLFR